MIDEQVMTSITIITQVKKIKFTNPKGFCIEISEKSYTIIIFKQDTDVPRHPLPFNPGRTDMKWRSRKWPRLEKMSSVRLWYSTKSVAPLGGIYRNWRTSVVKR